MKLDITLMRRFARPASPKPGVDKGALAAALQQATTKGQTDVALALCAQLETLEAHEPRWPRRRADLLRGQGRTSEAAQAYLMAAERYTRNGMERHAGALLRLARGLDPRVSPRCGHHPMLLESAPVG